MGEKIVRGLKILFVWQLCNLLFFVCLFFLMLFLSLVMGAIASSSDMPKDGISQLTIHKEGVSSKKGYVLQIPMAGIIMKQEPEFFLDEAVGPYERLIGDLKKAKKDKKVKAVLIVVNSPGGSVSVCDRMLEAINKFKEKTKLPVYAYYEDVAASGGVYTTVACDYIMASPTCITGSIGVIMGGMNIMGLMEKIGVKEQVYKSGELKDMGSGTRAGSSEEKKLLQDMVNQLFDRFVDIIVEGRGEKVKREDVIALKGAFFLPKKALENGLIDEIGSYDEIVAKIRKDLDEKYKIVSYLPKPDWGKLLGAMGTIMPKKMRNRLELDGPLYLFEL